MGFMVDDKQGALEQTLTDASLDVQPALPEQPLAAVDSARYQLRGEHGRGGLGVVMRALDLQLGREVAIKLLQNPSREAGARFRREATITSRLQHPSIVTVLDVVRWSDGSPAYTMPLYPGRSLRVAIDEAGGASGRMALLPNVLAVAEAIAHAHGRNVIHRDIKPSNVLLGSLGETVVIDWGLAKKLGDAETDTVDQPSGDGDLAETRVGQIMGTPAYMAPEQARGESVDKRADVYALGAVLYQLLVGRSPYQGSSAEVMSKLLDGPPADVAVLADGVPADLAAIVRKAMARTPDERYPDADAFARDLRRFLTGHLVEAHAYTPGQLVWRWLGRHRFLVSVSTAALVLVVAVVAVAFRRVQRERSAAQVAAASERSRADAMILTQAATALDRDPTEAIAWLKTYPLDAPDWARVRALAREAQHLGVARHVLHRAQNLDHTMLARADGGHLLLADGARTLVVWDVASGARRNVCLPGTVSDDLRDETHGHELVTLLTDGRVLVWNDDLSVAEQVAFLPGALTASLSSDGRWVALTRRSGLVTLVDRVGLSEAMLGVGDLPVSEARFVPDTSRLLVRSQAGKVLLYDVVARRVVWAGAPGVSFTALSRRGPHLVLSRRGLLEWLDAATLEAHGLPFRLNYFNPVDFFSDGRVLLAPRNPATVNVWHPHTGKLDELTLFPGPVAAAPGGHRAAVFDASSNVWVEDLDSNEERTFHGHRNELSRVIEFVGDDLAASMQETGGIRLWNLVPPPAEVLSLGGIRFEPAHALAQDGQVLVMSAQDGRVLRRDLRRKTQEVLFRTEGPALEVAASNDGNVVIALQQNGDLVRFDRRTGGQDVPFTGVGRLQVLVVSHDGRHAAGASFHESSAYFWDLERKTEQHLEDMNGSCDALVLAPDDQAVALGCALAGELGLTYHDFEQGTTRVLRSASPGVRLIGFTPSSRHVFGIALDGRVLRWDVATGAMVSRQVHSAEAKGGSIVGEDLLLSSGADGLRLSLFSLPLAVDIDAQTDLASSLVSRDLAIVGGRNHSSQGYLFWDLATHERWSVPLYEGKRPPLIAHDGSVVTSSLGGDIHIFAPPGRLEETPAQTRAWLDSLTSVGLGDERRPRPTCEDL